ncbi:hypothetical protein [Paenibacillus xylanexedens]|uniref:hypothetical protein n=1 Tax=Paenibacillus xylanexedens TaxID=528191 RepID=UPI0016424DE1|nr:hypothetical protein [Paenibacillus xylanexedens]
MGFFQIITNLTDYPIFVTAYADHAVEAFELHALDDVLKPIRTARLIKTMTGL